MSNANLLGIFLVVLGLASCSYRTDKETSVAPQSSGPRTISFATIQAEIIGPSCIRCHNGPTGFGRVDLSTYATTLAKVEPGKPEQSPFYTSIRDGRMPKRSPPLSAEKAALVRTWIEAGAKEDETAVVPPEVEPPNTPEPTYTWISKNIFEAKCAGCHGGADPAGQTSFDSYATLLASAGETLKPLVPGDPTASGIYVYTADGSMPMDSDPLSAEEVKAISDWILAGALEGVAKDAVAQR